MIKMEAVALVLYLIPLLKGLTEINRDAGSFKDWMRDHGVWFPSAAYPALMIYNLLWPLSYLLDVQAEIRGKKK
ncbi:MAG: hypothetical protein EP341_11420 [Sphingomonadales bacterium]|nr:MAG: hypothetical protein EP341_11420 [Sphingomonadales bacterium]